MTSNLVGTLVMVGALFLFTLYWNKLHPETPSSMIRIIGEQLFLTHSPSLAQVGTIVQKTFSEDKYYRVSNVIEVTPTALINGGTSRCWDVYGVYGPELTKED